MVYKKSFEKVVHFKGKNKKIILNTSRFVMAYMAEDISKNTNISNFNPSVSVDRCAIKKVKTMMMGIKNFNIVKANYLRLNLISVFFCQFKEFI